MEKRNKLSESDDFPKGKSAAMNFTRCWQPLFNSVSRVFGRRDFRFLVICILIFLMNLFLGIQQWSQFAYCSQQIELLKSQVDYSEQKLNVLIENIEKH